MNRIEKLFAESIRFVLWLLRDPVLLVISSRTDFFNYRRLLKLRFVGNPFLLPECSYYGHSRAVRNFGGHIFGSRIEHGVFFAETVVADMEAIFTRLTMRFYFLKRVYTFSRRRRKIILNFLSQRGLNIEVIPMGPYICYARHFMGLDRLDALKRRLGRVLLVYPQHSIETVANEYEYSYFIEKIESMQAAYDSVLISIYWVDALRGVASLYEKAGYTIVCAGRREDPNFLSRQKDLLYLSDRVLTNSVGTHLGYAIALNKPCTLFKQQLKHKGDSKEDLMCVKGSIAIIEQFFSVFAAEDGEITDEQRALVDEFWGSVNK